MAVTVAGARRIDYLSIPIHDLPEDRLEEAVRDMIDHGGKHQIVLVDAWDLIKARHNHEFARILHNASLVIPTTRGIQRVCGFLKRPVPTIYMPFEFIIKLLGILERYRKSVYLLGSTHQAIQTSASNLRVSFPGLNIVGRCSSQYKKEAEENIVLAIKKASPSLLLVGNGVKGRNRWVLDNQKNFSDGISLYCRDCYEIFAGKKRRLTRAAWMRGAYILPGLLTHPWRILRLFVYFYFLFVLLIARIRKA